MKLCRHCNKQYDHAIRDMSERTWPPKYLCSECKKTEWFYRVKETGTQLELVKESK